MTVLMVLYAQVIEWNSFEKELPDVQAISFASHDNRLFAVGGATVVQLQLV